MDVVKDEVNDNDEQEVPATSDHDGEPPKKRVKKNTEETTKYNERFGVSLNE